MPAGAHADLAIRRSQMARRRARPYRATAPVQQTTKISDKLRGTPDTPTEVTESVTKLAAGRTTNRSAQTADRPSRQTPPARRPRRGGGTAVLPATLPVLCPEHRLAVCSCDLLPQPLGMRATRGAQTPLFGHETTRDMGNASR